MPEYIRNSTLKDGDSLVFSPVTREGEENFSLWNNNEKKFLRVGEKVMTVKGEQEITKYISLTDEEKKFLGRNLVFQWTVLVDGEEKILSLKPTANTRLLEEMQTIESLGQNALQKQYEFKREGIGLRTKWLIRLMPQGTTTVSSGEIDIGLGDEDITLTPQEEKIIETIKEKAPNHTDEKKVDVFVKNGCVESRAKIIVENYF